MTDAEEESGPPKWLLLPIGENNTWPFLLRPRITNPNDQFLAQIEMSNLAASGKKQKGLTDAMLPEQAKLDFCPVNHAKKALLYGTGICLGFGAVSVVGIGYAMDVSNLQEFAAKMSIWTPQKLTEWGLKRPDEQFEKDKRAMAGMTVEQEVAHWIELVEQSQEEDGANANEGDDEAMGEEQVLQ